MTEWVEKNLEEIAEINPSESIKKGQVAKKVPMDKLQPNCRDIPGFEFEPYSGGAKFRNKDTIMARITPCLENGKIAQVNILDEGEIGFGSTEFLVFRARKGNDANFIYYLVSSPIVREPAIKSMVGSSGRQRVQTDVVKKLRIKVPSLCEQEAIAGILKSLDDKISANNMINHNLQQQVLAMYQKIFVDSPNDDRRICRADECFDISIGKTPPRKEAEWFKTVQADNIVWVSIADMGNCGLFIADSSEYLSPAAVKKFNVAIVPDNTVLLSFKLTVGRIAITDGWMTTNEAIAHFKTENKFINEYLYCYLKSYNFQTLGSTSSIATAVNSKIIKAMPFVVPTDDELAIFHNFAAPIFEKIKACQHENVQLTRLRDSLLPKLMNGEIDVSDVEI